MEGAQNHNLVNRPIRQAFLFFISTLYLIDTVLFIQLTYDAPNLKQSVVRASNRGAVRPATEHSRAGSTLPLPLLLPST